MVPRQELRFASTVALERALDGTDVPYRAYFFAIYHCSPDEQAGINERREQLRNSYPNKVINVGGRFVLSGEPAFLALAAYYAALAQAETLPDNHRAYASARLHEIENAHRDSQALPVPIDLTEGELSHDPRLQLLACLAIANGQVYVSTQ